MYYVYAESVLIINFCVNFILLYVLAKINKRKFLILRSIAAALIGAVYALLFVLNIKFFTYPLIKPLLAFLMVFISAKKLNLKTFLLLTAEYFILAFICAGAVLGTAGIFERKIQNISGVILFGSVSSNKLLMTALASAAAVIIIAEKYKNRNFHTYAQVDIKFDNGEICSVEAFADTGNLLKSISGKSIILVYKEPIKNYTGSYLNCDIEQALKDLSILENANKTTVITCNTPAGSKNIICIKPEEIKIKCGRNVHNVSGNALIGILDEPIAGPEKSANAIYNPIILSKGNICTNE